MNDDLNNELLNNSIPNKVKVAYQELIKSGAIFSNAKPELYRSVLHDKELIKTLLEPLDLNVVIDDTRGVVFLKIEPNDTEEPWTHTLVRRQPITLEQSLLIAILRQHYLKHEQEHGEHVLSVTININDIITHLNLFFQSTGSDQKDYKRASDLLSNLKNHRLVSSINEMDQIDISPLIVHAANPESLSQLLDDFKAYTHQNDSHEDN